MYEWTLGIIENSGACYRVTDAGAEESEARNAADIMRKREQLSCQFPVLIAMNTACLQFFTPAVI